MYASKAEIPNSRSTLIAPCAWFEILCIRWWNFVRDRMRLRSLVPPKIIYHNYMHLVFCFCFCFCIPNYDMIMSTSEFKALALAQTMRAQ